MKDEPKSGESEPATLVSPARSALVVEDLTKVFHDARRGDIRAVDRVSFHCEYGEIFALLGPNGAGKTTTLRMLATVLAPTSGSARVAGHDIRERPLEVRRSIGFLSGSTGLYARLTARETLEYFGRLHGIRREALERRVDELLDLFGIGEFADVRCEKLSTGMRQKVSIARSIVHDPPLLILDEPTLGLDIIVASAMLEFIERSREQGKAIIFSTHIMREVERLADRIGIIHQGSLRATGTLEELQEAAGARYLEDVFLRLVGPEGGDSS